MATTYADSAEDRYGDDDPSLAARVRDVLTLVRILKLVASTVTSLWAALEIVQKAM